MVERQKCFAGVVMVKGGGVLDGDGWRGGGLVVAVGVEAMLSVTRLASGYVSLGINLINCLHARFIYFKRY